MCGLPGPLVEDCHEARLAIVPSAPETTRTVRASAIPSTTVARALLDCRELIIARASWSCTPGRAEELIRRDRFDEVMAQLEQAHA